MNEISVGVIGAGRLGICFALLCESAGLYVTVSDTRLDYISELNNRVIKTNEPGVKELLRATTKFQATMDSRKVVEDSDVIFTFVPTPSLGSGAYDTRAIVEVISHLQRIKEPKILVIGSTVNPGDCEKFRNMLSKNIDLVYNPEFIAQGSIIRDLQNADMVLFGFEKYQFNEETPVIMQGIYKKIQNTNPVFREMSLMAAEVTKIAINSYLTIKISFANMIGDVLLASGQKNQISKVLEAIGTDSRIGNKYLKWGFGYGGPCLPRDNRALGHFFKNRELEFPLGIAADTSNEIHSSFLSERLQIENVNDKPYLFKSISYKYGTTEMTESQQLKLCIGLLESGRHVIIDEKAWIATEVTNSLRERFEPNLVICPIDELNKNDFYVVDI